MKIVSIVNFVHCTFYDPQKNGPRQYFCVNCNSYARFFKFRHFKVRTFKFRYNLTKRARILHMPFLFRCGIWLWGWEEGYFFMVVFSWVSGWGSELSSSTADCGAESHKLEEKFVRVRNCTDITILVRNISNCWVVWISRWSPPTDHWPTKCLV